MMLAAIMLAAAHAGGQPPTPAWLAGQWVHVTDAARADDHACSDEESKAWHRDGSFEDAAGGGRWQLAGTRLIEIGDDGEAHRSLVRRLGADHMQIVDEDGDKSWYARCRR